MQNRPDLYVPFIYQLAAIPYIWLGLFAWRKRPAVAVTPFAWMMLGLAIWSLFYSIELFLPTLSTALWMTRIEYLGIVSVPVFLVFFALEYAGKSHLLTLRNRTFIWTIPFLTLFLVWTNSFHHLMWSGESILDAGGLKLLNLQYGWFFWVHTIYSYILAVFASVLLIMEMMQRPSVYRVQISIVILCILTPLVGSLIYTSSFNPVPNLVITPLLFLPAALGLAWAVVRYRLMEILPLEHLAVLKNMKDGVIVVDANKRVLYLNPLMESLLGRLASDVIGQPLNHISKEHGNALSSYLATEHQPEMNVGTGEQAKVFEVTVSSLLPLNTPQNLLGTNSMITLHDITERKKTEASLSRRETMMSAISLAAEQLLKEATWEHNIPEVLEKIGEAARVSRVFVFMNYSDENGSVYSSQCYEWAGPGVTPQINNPTLQHINLREAGFGRWLLQLSQGKVIYGLLSEFPESEQKVFQSLDVKSMALVPIFVDRDWWGFIGFQDCAQEHYWSGMELEALSITARIFGSAENRARAEQKLVRRQQALSLLQNIVSKSLQAQTIQQMTEEIVGQLARLIHANECHITVWEKESLQTSLLASYGAGEDRFLPLQAVSGGQTFTELSLNLSRTLVIENSQNSSYINREIAKQCPARSLIVLPLIATEARFGALILAFKEHHQFPPEEVSICEQAANVIALAFEKFKALEKAQHRAATSETLRKAGAAITETRAIDETVNRILEQLKQVIPYDTASVQLLNRNGLKIIGGSGFVNPDEIIGLTFPIPGNNPNTVVMETGRPHLLSDVGDVYGEFKQQPHDHIRSWLGVPLIFQERVIGLLAVDSASPNQFTQETITLVTEFANQVAVALENSRIYEKAQTQAITDPLTGVYNRWGMFQLAQNDFMKSISLNRPFAGIMIDLDHFKQINDSYGHSVGDLVLREFAKRCKSCVREIDYVGRYGGEEFIIFLPETNIEMGMIVAERLRLTISDKPIVVKEGLEFHITASLGLAQRDENTTSLDMLITRADQAMYVSKHKGRNCVSVSI